MTHEYLDNRFLFPNPLPAFGEHLVNLNERATYPVLIKNIDSRNDLSTQKIIMHNKPSAEFWGFGDKSMADILAVGLYGRLPVLDKETHQKRVHNSNQTVLDSGKQNTEVQIIQDQKGFVRIYQRSVTPITGQVPNRVIAVCTTSMDITDQANWLYLWNVYKAYYDKTQLAAQKFSNYLKFERYFAQDLNCDELSILLGMLQTGKREQLAEILPVSDKPVARHVDTIQHKLKDNITIEIVLNALRTQHLWSSSSFE